MVQLRGIINLVGKNLVVLTLLGGGVLGIVRINKKCYSKAISEVINLGIGLHIKIGNFNSVDTVFKDLQKLLT